MPSLPRPSTPPRLGRLGAPPGALPVVVYLFLVTIGCGGGLIYLFPQIDAEATTERTFDLTPDAPADSALHLRAGFPRGLDPTLTDSVSIALVVEEGVDSTLVARLDTTFALKPTAVSSRALFVLVLLVGALGATLHGLASVVEFVGNRDFQVSWTLWYAVRPFVGALLAGLLYFISLGIVEIETRDEFYGFLAVAGLVGLFSKQALYKLGDVFDVLFQTDREKTLRDKLRPATLPVASAVEPEELAVGAVERDVTVTGTGFMEGAVVRVQPVGSAGALGEPRGLRTVVESPMSLRATMREQDVMRPGELELEVFNPGPTGGTSGRLVVRVVGPSEEPEIPTEPVPVPVDLPDDEADPVPPVADAAGF